MYENIIPSIVIDDAIRNVNFKNTYGVKLRMYNVSSRITTLPFLVHLTSQRQY